MKLKLGLILAVVSLNAFSQTKNLLTVDNTKFPKSKESFNAVEIEQIKFLGCLRYFIQERKAAYNGPSLAHNLLMKGMLDGGITNDVNLLSTLSKDCKDLSKQETSFSKNSINKNRYLAELDKLPTQTGAQIKSTLFIRGVGDPGVVMCKTIGVGGEVYVGVGGGASVEELKCLLSDGRVRNYIGPSVKVGVGIGASAGLEVCDHEFKFGDIAANDLAAMSIAMTKEDGGEDALRGVVLVKSHSSEDNKNVWENSLKAGAIYEHDKIKVRTGIRVFNGKVRWSKMLQTVK